MKCKRCGIREASVHLVDLVDGKRSAQWLCTVCAGKSRNQGDDPDFPLGGRSGDGDNIEDSYSLASFLGEMFSPTEEGAPSEPPVCPACRYTFAEFRGTNRLGCPKCYEAFRQPLLSILSHLHRHVSHLGKVPGRLRDPGNPAAALSRARIDLEKAIAAEDFEKAARLRDAIQKLEKGVAPDGEGEQ